MDLEHKTLRLDARLPADLARAAAILGQGGTVAFPTETVYGLGANALLPGAVEQIFAAKERPHWDPLIVHVAGRAMLDRVCNVPPRAEALIARFWPGPLTLLLPRTPQVPDSVTAGRPLVGVRTPAHPIALELIRQAGVPIAAPSANTFGHTSPTTAAHVLADLDGRIDAVLDGGPTQVGLESTVCEVVPDGIVVYRPGAVTLEMLDLFAQDDPSTDLGWVRLYQPEAAAAAPPTALPSPGVGIRHYAPRARLVLVDSLAFVREETLVPALDAAFDGVQTVGVMLPEGWSRSAAQLVYPWGPWHDRAILAQRLFDGLRTLDDQGATVIVCPLPGPDGLGAALRDRLQKAART